MAAPPTLHSVLEPWCCLRERGAREVQECKRGTYLAEQKELGVETPTPSPSLCPGMLILLSALHCCLGMAELQRAVSGVGETPARDFIRFLGQGETAKGSRIMKAPRKLGFFLKA